MKFKNEILLFLSALAPASALAQFNDNNFANAVVASSALKAAAPYNSPASILGSPTSWVKDSFSGDPANGHRIPVSLSYAPWNVDLNGNPVEAKIQYGESVTVKFNQPIVHSSTHWYGDDFIVYNNPFFISNSGINYKSDMANVKITGLYSHPLTVSVSADNTNWYTYSTVGSDRTFPTEAFRWNGQAHAWGAAEDYTKPLDPSLTTSSLIGMSNAQAIAAYNGSAGGTAFSLAGTGLNSIQYIKFTGATAGAYSVVDAVARVGSPDAVPEPASFLTLGLGFVALSARRRRA